MKNLLDWLKNTVDLNPEIQTKILISIIVIIILWFLRKLVLRIVYRKTEKPDVLYQWRKISAYVTSVIAVLIIGRIWFKGFESISTFIGLLSAGVAIALKDLLVSFVGWAFILWRKPFSIGDRIQLGDCAGDVIDIRIFQFTLMEIGNWVDAEQSTGRIIHVPNGYIFTQVLANYSKGFQYIWNEIPVLVTFESDWEKAEKILQKIANIHAKHLSASAEKKVSEASRKFMIYYSTLTPIVYTSVKDCGVLLTIRYLCKPRERRSTEEAIWKDILREFAKYDDIDFAYPTQRFYNNIVEGRTGTKPPTSDEK